MRRAALQFQKKQALEPSQNARESEKILSQIGQIKGAMSPYLSNTKMSDGREKWFQYLPSENQPNHHLSSLSRDSHPNDNYLHSLERRLENLFRQEKDMLRERHHKNEQVSHGVIEKRYRIEPPREGEYSLESMDRKVRELEERYRRQEHPQQPREERGKKMPTDHNRKKEAGESPIQRSGKEGRAKAQSEYSPTANKDLLTQSVEECVAKERQLEEEVEELKRSVRELRENNEEVLRRVQHREERRKQKRRSKELLQSILLKLEYINVELVNSKKRAGQGEGRIKQEAADLQQQFELLREQYRHLEEERRKVESKQSQIERRLGGMFGKEKEGSD